MATATAAWAINARDRKRAVKGRPQGNEVLFVLFGGNYLLCGTPVLECLNLRKLGCLHMLHCTKLQLVCGKVHTGGIFGLLVRPEGYIQM